MMRPHLMNAKIEEGIFVGPQMTKFLHSDEFRDHLTPDQRTAHHLNRLMDFSLTIEEITKK